MEDFNMYFCKNCGESYIADEAVICIKCGVSKGLGTNYCYNCAKPIVPDSMACLNCGVANRPPVPVNAKSKVAAGIMGIILGNLGIHNFYLGYTSKAVCQLVLTLLGMALSFITTEPDMVFIWFMIGKLMVFSIYIWGLIEGVMILTGKINTDGDGMQLAT